MNKQRNYGIIFIFVLSLFCFPVKSDALSCAEILDPFEVYDIAVLGEVKSVKEHSSVFDAYKEVEFHVASSWKDYVPSNLSFKADFSWGYDFIVGESYYIYLNQDENGAFYHSPCSEIIIIDKTFDYTSLPPGAFEPNMQNQNGKGLFLTLGIVGVVSSLTAIGLTVQNRRKKKLPKNNE